MVFVMVFVMASIRILATSGRENSGGGMIPSRVIEAKRDGASIPAVELEAFFQGFLHDRIPDYQMAAFLMAAYFGGVDAAEADVLVRCMLASGSVLDLSHLPGPRVDKHSTGGVGDKVSLVYFREPARLVAKKIEVRR